MSGCEPTDEVKRIIRAMARAKLEEGVTGHQDIVDAIHDAIHEHTALWKDEIADIISGYGTKRQATKTELQERLLQLKRDLREAYHPKVAPAKRSPEEVRNATRQTQLKKQIAEVQDRIARQDFSKPAKQPFTYDAATQKLQSDLAASKLEADKLMHRLAFQNQSRAARMVDTALAAKRAFILSGYTVAEHLAGAVALRMLFTPLEQGAGALLQHVPGLRGVFEHAPTEGGGFQGRAQLEGLKKAFSSETGRDMLNKLRRGYSDKQAQHEPSRTFDANHPWLEMVGRLHDTMKTPAENFGYHRALWTGAIQARKAMARDGMSPDAIDTAMADPAMQAKLSVDAFAESKRAKLQGENWMVDWVREALRGLERKGPGGKAIAALGNYMMPILKIPTNLAAEAASYGIGEGKALSAAIFNKRTEGHFTPEVNDYIARNLKKGLVGKALMALGWIGYEGLGALYDERRRKRGGEPDYGDVRVNGHTVSHHWLHSPALALLQAAALSHRIYDAELAKSAKTVAKGGEPTSRTEAAITGAQRGAIGIARDLPFISGPVEFAKSLADAKGTSDYAGKVASEFTTPQIVKQAAKAMDPYGDVAKRNPKGFVQQLEVGIPGLRQNVPLKDFKGQSLDSKLDAWDHATPAQREELGLRAAILKTAKSQRRNLTDDQLQRLEAIQ